MSYPAYKRAKTEGHEERTPGPTSNSQPLMYAVPLLGDSVYLFNVQAREIFKENMNVQATGLQKGIC